jgi:chemotaxis protein histidine kinase CheA
MLYTEQPPPFLLLFPCTNVRRSKAAAEQKVKEDEAAAAKRAAAKKAKWQERRSQKRSRKASGAPEKPKWIAGDWGSVIAVDRKLEEYATADAIEVAKKAAAFKKAEKEKAAAAEKTSADAAAENASVEAATKAAAEAAKNLKVASENELVVAATKQVAERIAAATKQAAERARPSLTMFKKILPWTTADGPSLCHSALAWKMMKDAPSTGCKTEFALGWEGQIFVKQAGWRTVVLRVTSEDSVGSLKTRLNRSNSRLIRSTRELWDDTRSLGSYGVRKEDTLLLCGRLLGGMPTGHPETAARAPAQTATPLDADAQGPPEPGPSEHLDAARRALVRAEGLAAELAGDLARIFPPPAAASPASEVRAPAESAAPENEVAQRHAKLCMDASGLIRKGKFGGIAVFDSTLEEQVGCMDALALRGMYAEHVMDAASSAAPFSPPNNPSLTCTPEGEFWYVVGKDGIDITKWEIKPGALPAEYDGCMVEGRNATPLSELLQADEAKRAKLRDTELIALRLYSGKKSFADRRYSCPVVSIMLLLLHLP